MNRELAQRGDRDLDRTLCGKAGSKRELLAYDRQAMLDLPRQPIVPASKAGAELLFDVIGATYERRSLVVTTPLSFEH